MNVILCGDALSMLKMLPDESVDMCLTSPPYYGLRNYLVDGQIGLEKTPDEYIERLTEVFREVRRVLTSKGVFWLNISDSYAGSSKGALKQERLKDIKTKQSYRYTTDNPAAQMPKTWNGIKPKNLIGIPWGLAFALRRDGWTIRSDVIWQKPNTLPESVTDRPVRSYEHIFLLTKSPKYYFNHEVLKEPVAEGTVERMRRGISASNKYANGAPGQPVQSISRPRESRIGKDIELPTLRNGRDIWSIPTKAFRGDYEGTHFATFPVELATKCILSGCPENGIVIDPFYTTLD